MKKYVIEFTEDQLRIAINAIEDISRYAAGDTELWQTNSRLIFDDPYCEKKHKVEDLLKQVKDVIYPDLPYNSNYGYTGHGAPHKEQQKLIADTYQVYRTLIHYVTVANNIDNVYSSPTLTVKDSVGQPKLIEVKPNHFVACHLCHQQHK